MLTTGLSPLLNHLEWIPAFLGTILFYVHVLNPCSVGGSPSHLKLKLPVMVNKFIEPATMESGDFFSRWKQLAG